MGKGGRVFFIFVFLGSLTIFLLGLIVFLTTRVKPKVKPKPAASIFLSPQQVFKEVGETFPLEIKFDSKQLPVSAITLRLIYPYSKASELAVEDADQDSTNGVQININPLLLEQNWVFPINRVIKNLKEKRLVIELSGINITPTGYFSPKNTLLATINFKAHYPAQGNFHFDPKETKILTKNKENLFIQTQGAALTIKLKESKK